MVRASALAAAALFASVLGGCNASDPCGIKKSAEANYANPQLRVCAFLGNARAQAYLGMSYWVDSESDRLDERARDHLRAEGRRLVVGAARRGVVEAQNELGLAYLEPSFGLPQDYAQARRWLEAAANAGDSRALYNLAQMHYSGLGVARSEVEAERLLWLSVNRGYYPPLCALAVLREYDGDRRVAEAFKLAAAGMGESCRLYQDEVVVEFPRRD